MVIEGGCLDVLDADRRRAGAALIDEAGDIAGLALDDGLDGAVAAVADPAGQPQPARALVHPGAIAHALDAAVHQDTDGWRPTHAAGRDSPK